MTNMYAEVHKSKKFQYGMLYTAMAHIGNRRKDTKDKYAVMTGYDIAMYTQKSEDLEHGTGRVAHRHMEPPSIPVT